MKKKTQKDIETNNPHTENKKKKPRKKAWIFNLSVFLVALILLTVIMLSLVDNGELYVSFYQYKTDLVSSRIRILELADLHLRTFGEDNILLVERVTELKPDIIVIVGDMVMQRDPDCSVMLNLCKKLVDIAPVYYSLGNHEYNKILSDENSTLISDITATGVTLLNDTYVETTVNGNKLYIGGICKNPDDLIRYSKEFLEDFSSNDDGLKILLSHYPEVYEGAINDYDINLTFCAHAHGGMIKLPFFGALYTPDQGFLPELVSGSRTIDNTNVVISRGLGNSSNIPRINNPPEIVVTDINWH